MINDLIKMSNEYGKNPDYVLAGGGNTSCKDADFLYVKGSGQSLATIKEDGFVKIDRKKLSEIFTKEYSSDPDTREAEVLADLMASKTAGQEAKRPSVEALLDDVLPFKFVLHIHPSMTNGITCAKDGKAWISKLFGDCAIWIDQIMPGYILACKVRDEFDSFTAKNGKKPTYIFLENHGVFTGGETLADIDASMDALNNAIKANVKEMPDYSEVDFDVDLAVSIAPKIRVLCSDDKLGIVTFRTNKIISDFVKDEKSFSKALLTFSPDHMVYCFEKAVFCEAEDVNDAISDYIAQYKKAPRIIGIKGLGYFAFGENKKSADISADIFLDAIKVAFFAENFGGGKSLCDELVYAIANWEVERYRKSVSALSGSKRLQDKIAIITGSAQGFGKGVAEEMAAQGAYIGVADLNEEGANTNADALNSCFGKGTAIGIKVNVGEEDDVKAMVDKMVLAFGGLDIFVSNAGIVRSGGLDEMDLVWFERMTKINYTAFYLCSKYASKIMKIQNSFGKKNMFDIIQINSKSGLSGSNKNFAYAGGKFGGIGLCQSFAMELAPFGIKVNAICPGNFFDGPLWSDPEKGLFIQYLNSGKVPGAKTVEDVKKAYESKVPLGRGTEVKDVARAIFYVVEQEYETGQAIPVTGGQEMLK